MPNDNLRVAIYARVSGEQQAKDDTIDHGHLREFLKRRVRDGVILRLIGKWLNAGVLEDGELTIPDDGTPQGGVISPPTMLQNRP